MLKRRPIPVGTAGIACKECKQTAVTNLVPPWGAMSFPGASWSRSGTRGVAQGSEVRNSLANQETGICYVISRQVQNGPILMRPLITWQCPRMQGYKGIRTGPARPLCLKTATSSYLAFLHCKYIVSFFQMNEISEHILIFGWYTSLWTIYPLLLGSRWTRRSGLWRCEE